MTSSTNAWFAPLNAAISRKNDEDGFGPDHPWYHQLIIDESHGLVDVQYRGEYELWFNDRTTVPILEDLLRLLASGDVAHALRSFTYRTEAVLAANGTYDFNIDALVDGTHVFPNLTRLSLDQGEGEHGYKILTSPSSGDDWQEAGVLARVLDKAPTLKELVVPVPPDESFFRGPSHPLRSLDVDAGFGHADFIKHLAASTRFEQLRQIVFTDFRQHYLSDWREQTTTFEAYSQLFNAPIASRLDSICLREVNLTDEQVRSLLAIRSDGVEIERAK
jgi:hypothetical protein